MVPKGRIEPSRAVEVSRGVDHCYGVRTHFEWAPVALVAGAKTRIFRLARTAGERPTLCLQRGGMSRHCALGRHRRQRRGSAAVTSWRLSHCIFRRGVRGTGILRWLVTLGWSTYFNQDFGGLERLRIQLSGLSPAVPPADRRGESLARRYTPTHWEVEKVLASSVAMDSCWEHGSRWIFEHDGTGGADRVGSRRLG